MPEIEVRNLSNDKVGTLSLDEKIFGAQVDARAIGLVHEAVTMQLASRRQGTASTKTRGLVRGGGKKPWKQKGTGRARAGSTRSPIWRGGGTIFGPLPRSYSYAFPKKKGRKSLHFLLSDKVQNGRLIVVEELEISEPKTKLLVRSLAKLDLRGTTLILSAQQDEKLQRASRNLPGVKLLDVRNLNPYDLIRHDYVLLGRRDLVRLVELWGDQKRGAHGAA
ncbi:MAG TPA: 50S ribosomal protein L4 [Nitrospiria bacterium]|nr:50S ribosomal protein L4 [Nitrospiria bacterium]